jgi:hypothetical protein
VEETKVGQTLSSMPNTISNNLDKISELFEGAYVRAFKACNLHARTSKLMDEKVKPLSINTSNRSQYPILKVTTS